MNETRIFVRVNTRYDYRGLLRVRYVTDSKLYLACTDIDNQWHHLRISSCKSRSKEEVVFFRGIVAELLNIISDVPDTLHDAIPAMLEPCKNE